MNLHLRSCLFSSALLLFILFSTLITSVSAQDTSLIQEAQQHWETYGVGGACNHATQNLHVADVDGDGVMEIIVGAFMYHVINGSTTPSEGSIRIWNWNGQNVTLEKAQNWAGATEVTYVADADGDDIQELFTAGVLRNETGVFGSLRVWQWYHNELSLVTHKEGFSVESIFVADVDTDGSNEIITVGRMKVDSHYAPQLCIWKLEQNNLILMETLALDAADVASAISVYAHDLDDDGETEIITGGYSGALNNSKGQLSIWNWNGEELSLKADEKWQMVANSYAQNIAGGVLGNTVVYNLKVGDVDGDGAPEIVTAGFVYDGEDVNGQLLVWSWDGVVLTQKSHTEWISDSITLVYCISLDDVDGDSRLEVVAGGMTGAYGSFKTDETSLNRGQLGVWGWDGKSLVLEHTQDWTIGEGTCVWNVGTADLDNDGKVEIVTSGCMSINRLCDPDMRIWSIQAEPVSQAYLLFAVVGITAVAVIFAAVYLLKRRK